MRFPRRPATAIYHRWHCTDDKEVGRVCFQGPDDNWYLEVSGRGNSDDALFFTVAETRLLFGDVLADFVRDGRDGGDRLSRSAPCEVCGRYSSGDSGR